MNKLKHIIKLIIKCVYFNGVSKLSIGRGSGICAFSKVLFSGTGIGKEDQSITIGNNAGVGRFCELHVWENNHIQIKDHATINDGCKILGDVTIERYSLLSSNIYASSGNHYAMANSPMLIRDQDKLAWESRTSNELSQHIHIEEDCWVGFGVYIKHGVYIGRGAIIGANSVVMNDIEPYCIHVGSPAKEIKKRLSFEPPRKLVAMKDEHMPYFYRGFEQLQKDLTESRKENAVFSLNESMAVLEGGEKIDTIVMKGKLTNSSNKLELLVTLNRELQWNVTVDQNNFELKLDKKNASLLANKQVDVIFNTTRDILSKYNVITFKVIKPLSQQASFGIEEIETIKA